MSQTPSAPTRRGFNLPKSGTALGQIIEIYPYDNEQWATIWRLDKNQQAAVVLSQEGFDTGNGVLLHPDGKLEHAKLENHLIPEK